jgi:branched-chain amino acid transport system ATP-binding protein
MTKSPVLELHAVGKHFAATEILRDVNLTLHQGECLALIGPNGAGKSTLVDLISGKTAMTTGDIFLHGHSVRKLRPDQICRRGLARSFQTSTIFPKLSVFENLRCAVLGASAERYVFWRALGSLQAVTEKTRQLLEEIGMAARATVLAGKLSYAEQRTLELGMTLASNAQVILLDEPSAGMNRQETEAAVTLIRRLTAHAALIIVEHDMQVVFDLADRIAVLVGGRIIACDTPARIRANQQVQDAYLGRMPEATT